MAAPQRSPGSCTAGSRSPKAPGHEVVDVVGEQPLGPARRAPPGARPAPASTRVGCTTRAADDRQRVGALLGDVHGQQGSRAAAPRRRPRPAAAVAGGLVQLGRRLAARCRRPTGRPRRAAPTPAARPPRPRPGRRRSRPGRRGRPDRRAGLAMRCAPRVDHACRRCGSGRCRCSRGSCTTAGASTRPSPAGPPSRWRRCSAPATPTPRRARCCCRSPTTSRWPGGIGRRPTPASTSCGPRAGWSSTSACPTSRFPTWTDVGSDGQPRSWLKPPERRPARSSVAQR